MNVNLPENPSINPNITPVESTRTAPRRNLVNLNALDLITPSHQAPAIKKAFVITSQTLDALDLAVEKPISNAEPLTEAQEVANRNDDKGLKRLWECVGRSPNGTGGFVYKYRLRDEFNVISGGDGSPEALKEREKALDKQASKLFPAVEPYPTSLYQLFVPKKGQKPPEWVQVLLRRGRATYTPEGAIARRENNLASKLGYAMREVTVGGKREVILEVPDREAVLGNWKYQQERKGKGPIDISLSKGIASDLAFVEMFFKHDVIMSTGVEFVHDSFSHVIPILRMIYDSGKKDQTYAAEKFRVVKEVVAPYYQKITKIRTALADGVLKLGEKEKNLCEKQLNYLGTALGAVVDVTLSYSSYSEIKDITKEFVDGLIRDKWESNDNWQKFFQESYPDVDGTAVLPALNKLEEEIDTKDTNDT